MTTSLLSPRFNDAFLFAAALVEVFRARGIPSGLLRELELTVAQLERLVGG